jgi:hypothetical protein
VREQYRQAGMEITAIHPGSWPGRREYLSYQDIVIARKPGGEPDGQ